MDEYVTEVVAEAPEGEPADMDDEGNAIVHEVWGYRVRRQSSQCQQASLPGPS